MRKNYTPREGSAVARAIAYLGQNGLVTSSDLAAGIGVKVPDLAAHLKPGLKHGLLRKEFEAGDLIWGLGDGTPADPAADTGGDPDAAEQTEPFTCALFSDGELCLMHAGRDDAELVLTRDQTLELINYLFRFEYSTEPGEVLPSAPARNVPKLSP